MIAFEYQPPTERNGQSVSLHNNHFDERTGMFQYPLFSNGYYPIAMIPDEYRTMEDWVKFCDWIYSAKPSVKDATIVAWNLIATISAKS